jgi:hypothetical protein
MALHTNNKGSILAMALAVATIGLVMVGYLISAEMRSAAITEGSSTRPNTPGSIQDQRSTQKSPQPAPPLIDNNVPPAKR